MTKSSGHTDFVWACSRCGSGIDAYGFCADVTCPYSDYQQNVPYAAMTEMDTAQFRAIYERYCRKNLGGETKDRFRRHFLLVAANDDGSVFASVQEDAHGTGWEVLWTHRSGVGEGRERKWINGSNTHDLTDEGLAAELYRALQQEA